MPPPRPPCLATVEVVHISWRLRWTIGVVFCIGFVGLGITVGALGALAVNLAAQAAISIARRARERVDVL